MRPLVGLVDCVRDIDRRPIHVLLNEGVLEGDLDIRARKRGFHLHVVRLCLSCDLGAALEAERNAEAAEKSDPGCSPALTTGRCDYSAHVIFSDRRLRSPCPLAASV